ncbi:protein serine/threonine kinase [Clonorchis sinensis]|uniref:Protein serine/threonine kinase n=1 Tax=Clonorchis sinensis TaxID=79923 RepID=G7YRA8_CLOSI|nr:protein serine/threonine kinase [Clonorchis sinensis]
MEQGDNKTEGPPLTPVQPRRLLSCSSVMPGSMAENQGIGPQTSGTSPFQLSRQILHTFAAYQMSEGPRSNEETYDTRPFRSEPSASDIQALTQHLLALTNSSTSPDAFAGSLLHIHSDEADKWKRHSGRSLNASPTHHTCDHSNDATSSVSMSPNALCSAEGVNALNRLASLSKAWSTTSPSAMAALAQLTLLGLSPSVTPTRESSVTNILLPGDSNGTQSAFSSKTSKNLDFDPSTPNGRGSKNSHIVDQPSNHSPQHNKTDFGSKVIIRQTADADEHFFKALRRLKVDVSPELQSSELKAVPSASKPVRTDVRLPTDHRHSPVTSTCNRTTAQTNRSAAELAVDEHFEKSLGAFPGFRTTRETGSEVLSSKSKQGLVAQHQHSGLRKSVGIRTTRTSPVEECDSPKHGRSKVLVRQQSQRGNSPTGSPLFACSNEEPMILIPSEIPQPPPYNRERLPHFPEQCTSQPSGLNSSKEKSNQSDQLGDHLVTNRTSPITSVPEATKFLSKSIVPSTTLCVQPSANTFKPKKNWLAQYDWTENQPSTGVDSPGSPTETHPTGTDSVGSSPLFFPVRMDPVIEDVSHVPSVSSPQQQNEHAERYNEHFVPILDTYGPVNENKTSSQSCPKEAQPSNNSPMQATMTTTSRAQCGHEKSSEEIQAVIDTPEDKFAVKSPETHLISITTVEPAKAFQRDSATSPFPVDNPTIQTSDNFSSEGISSIEKGESKLMSVSKSMISCSLSNPPSPCPVVGEESGVSAVTPVSGTTSGFFSGSTYSLDSSLSQPHALGYDNRELDSGIDVKSLSSAAEERSFSDSKSQTGMSIASKIDNTDTPGLTWSLRKRASSEASPWSTLKRSRSVLTSPISYNETCPSCSPISRELLNEAIDEPVSSGADRYGVLTEFTSRSMDGTSRPLTPDLSKSQTNKRLVHQRNVSEMQFKDDERFQTIDSQMPRYYNLYRNQCEHKSNSEPSTMSNNPTVASIGRSLSDAATLPSLHLTHDKNVYIL